MSLASQYLEALQHHYTPPGEQYPWRYPIETTKVESDNDHPVSQYVSIGFCDGEPFDVSISGPLVGSDTYETLRDVSILVSLALQNGVSPQDLWSAAGRHEDGRARSLLGKAADVLAGYV